MSKAWEEKPPDHYWVQHDAAPKFTEQLLDGAGDPVNLAGAAVAYVLRAASGAAPAVNAAATIEDAAQGLVSFTPTTTHTQNYGDYAEVWRVTFSGGAPETFPVEPHKVRIRKATHTTP